MQHLRWNVLSVWEFFQLHIFMIILSQVNHNVHKLLIKIRFNQVEAKLEYNLEVMDKKILLFV